MKCKCEGCDREARYVGSRMCAKHHRNMRVHGTPEAPPRATTPRVERERAALQLGLAQAIEVGDCLEWQGKYACSGATPIIKVYDGDKGRADNLSVPRLLWERARGPIPPGKLVYRTCCNNACVLDAHLACGTRKDWARARKKAGATKHSPTTRLHLTLAARRRADVVNTIEKARSIRTLAAARVKTDVIALATGVHPTMVSEIRQGRSWRELGASPWQGLGA